MSRRAEREKEGVELLAELLADVDPAAWPELSKIEHGEARVWDWAALCRALNINMWEVWRADPHFSARAQLVFKGTRDEADAYVQQQPPTWPDGSPNGFLVERAR